MTLTLLKLESSLSIAILWDHSRNMHSQLTQGGRSILSWEFRSSGHSQLGTWPEPPFSLYTDRRERHLQKGKERRTEAPRRQRHGVSSEGDWKDACQLSPSCFTSFPLSCEQFTPALPPVLLLCCSEDSIKAKYKYLYWHCDGRM